MRYLLSVDCGLTKGKAALFDETGRKLAESSTSTPLKGLEMDADALWEHLAACIRETIQKSGLVASKIAAVGLSGHGNGLYALNDEGQPVAAVSSMYDRNQDQVDAFRADREAYGRFLMLTEQSSWGGQPMQILRHMKKTDPERYLGIRHFFCCKDYLRWRLTGQIGTDYSDFSASALAAGEAGREICRLLEIPEMADRLPSPIRCDEVGGFVTPEAAALTGLSAGTPVAAGGIDLFACMLGTGITDEGVCSVTAGTWGIAAAYAEKIMDTAPLTQKCGFLPGFKSVGIVSGPTSCVNLDWFLRAIRPEMTYDEVNREVLRFSPEDVQVIYLPFLHRDMAHPHVDCAFRGLSPSDTWREMLRAVFEGVCFAHRLQIERLRRAGIWPARARLSGGASASLAWQRLMSDILNLPIETSREKQAGLLGAAMMAGVSVGVFSSLQSAAEKMSRVEKVFDPQPNEAYEEKYRKFKKWVGE